MLLTVALCINLSAAVAAKIAMFARRGFKAVEMLVAAYPEFRGRHPSNAGKCRAMGFATGCAVTVNDAPYLGRKFIGHIATEAAT